MSAPRDGYEGTLVLVGGPLNGTEMDFYDAVPDRARPIETICGRYEFRADDPWRAYFADLPPAVAK